MKKLALLALLPMVLLVTPSYARGCIGGAIVGGAAGHMIGHGLMGAAGGCAIGHHEAARRDRERYDQNRYDQNRYGYNHGYEHRPYGN